jgi:hypothetical protein
MTQDEIIEMATQVYGKCDWHESALSHLEALIKLAAAKEREACAKVADYYANGLDRNYSEIIADAIRARGEQA